MEKRFLLIAFFSFCFLGAGAQVDPYALGLRLTAGSYSGTLISYQHGFDLETRFQLDVGWGFTSGRDRLLFSGIFQKAYPIVERWGWFGGGGAVIGFVSNNSATNNSNTLYLGPSAMAGLEYRFDVPLRLTLDIQPVLNLIPELKLEFGIGFGARYAFGH
ncbi:MAG: hypothetical protein RMK52_05295 [Chitinophagales bacterium]|nr:hypothetical protein [Chitinophagales bacterium]MDW8393643.1 hypothetical protein [Chitinophagales bacterium]